jgi:hypothetical protein
VPSTTDFCLLSGRLSSHALLYPRQYPRLSFAKKETPKRNPKYVQIKVPRRKKKANNTHAMPTRKSKSLPRNLQ